MFNTKEKKERALGVRLFLKPNRCSSPKCAAIRHSQRPGVHGSSFRRPISEVGQQLLEKQKIRFSYGIREAQLRKLFSKAMASKAITGQLIVSLLEKRLDNVVYRLGLAPSRSVARQLIGHGHIWVDGRRVTVPSYQVEINKIISIRPQSKNHPLFKDLDVSLKKYEPPVWLTIDKEKKEGKLISSPQDIETPFDISLVVDYYAKRL